MRVIKWNDENLGMDINDVVVVRHPIRDFNAGTEIVVEPSQVAIFYAEGTFIRTFTEGRYKLLEVAKTRYADLINNVTRGGENPYTTTIIFVNKVYMTDLGFGTNSPIQIVDPIERFNAEIKANGTFEAHIEDPEAREFMEKVVGTRPLWTKKDFENLLRARIVSGFTSSIREIIRTEKISVFELDQDLIGSKLTEKMEPLFARYGVKIDGFAFETIKAFDVDGGMNEAAKRRQERQTKIDDQRAFAEAERYEREQLAEARGRELDIEYGVKGKHAAMYEAETRREVLTAAGGNEGTAGAFMGAGMGLGMGVGMGGAFGAGLSNMAQGTFQQQPYGAPPMTPPPIQQVAFHVAINGQTYGPYDMNALSQMLVNGTLTRDTLVWKQGMPSWAQAGMVPELQQLFSVPPIPGNVPPVPPAPPVPPTL